MHKELAFAGTYSWEQVSFRFVVTWGQVKVTLTCTQVSQGSGAMMVWGQSLTDEQILLMFHAIFKELPRRDSHQHHSPEGFTFSILNGASNPSPKGAGH